MDLLIHGKCPYKLLHSDQRDKTKPGLSSAVRGCTAVISVPCSRRNNFFRADISYRALEGWQSATQRPVQMWVTPHLVPTCLPHSRQSQWMIFLQANRKNHCLTTVSQLQKLHPHLLTEATLEVFALKVISPGVRGSQTLQLVDLICFSCY